MLEMLNPYRWLLAIGLVGALFLGYHAWAKHQQGIGYAKAQGEYQARELAAVQAARAEEQRRTQAVQEIAHETDAALARARADHAAAVGAGQRLRQQLAAAHAAACRAAPAGAGLPAAAAGDLLADVQRRLDEAADAIAQHADAASAAGAACQRSYEALTP